MINGLDHFVGVKKKKTRQLICGKKINKYQYEMPRLLRFSRQVGFWSFSSEESGFDLPNSLRVQHQHNSMLIALHPCHWCSQSFLSCSKMSCYASKQKPWKVILNGEVPLRKTVPTEVCLVHLVGGSLIIIDILRAPMLTGCSMKGPVFCEESYSIIHTPSYQC